LDYCVGHYENSEIAQIILETYEEEDIKKLTGSRDGNGDTALHIAARFGSFECIGLLLGWISKYRTAAGSKIVHISNINFRL